MKLCSPREMTPRAGICCRQSPLRGTVGGLVLCAAVLGAALLWRHLGAPWLIWGGCALLAAVVVPAVLADMLAKWRASNWLLWVSPDGLWINLRSYQNPHLPEAATLLHLPYAEVACAQRHIETWTTPSTPSGTTSTHWQRESLDLHLAPAATEQIASALAEERSRKAPARVVAGGVRIARKGLQQAVTVPRAGTVRLAWRGAGHDVAPPLQRVLDELGIHVALAEPARTDRPDWQQLSDAELDDLVAQMVRSGDRLEATQLLVRRRGCSTTEAHRLVEELDRTV